MNPFAGLQPVSVPFSGNCDGAGNFTFTTRPRPAFWCHMKMAAEVTAGVPAWTVRTGAGPIGYGRGAHAEVAPILLAPGDLVTVAVVGASPGAAVTGQLVGAQAPTAVEAMAYNPSVSTVSLETTSPRQQLWPDGTPVTARKGPSFTVAVNALVAKRFTFPAGTTDIRINTNANGVTYNYSLSVVGVQSANQYFPNAPGGTGPVVNPSLPVTFQVDTENDTQLDITINNLATSAGAMNVFINFLTAVEAVSVVASLPLPVAASGAPAPWQAATSNAAIVAVSVVSGGTQPLVVAAPGVTLYLHGYSFSQDNANTTARWSLQDSTGLAIADFFEAAVRHVFASGDFRGFPLALGRGVQMVNGGAAASFLGGFLSYSLG